MRVHHLNCGSMVELDPQSGPDSPLRPEPTVCHCLLIETDHAGLVLVETGFGLADTQDPSRLGTDFTSWARPVLDPEQTALRQIVARGHDPADVRHIVVTHLHRDHTGGLPDFPQAKVHLHEAELQAARDPALRARYPQPHWDQHTQWISYGAQDGEPWFGFEGVRELRGLPPEMLLVPLAGHTPGHVGVAVNAGPRWLLHAGDLYFHHTELDPDHPRGHPMTDALQSGVESDRPLRLGNVARVRELARLHRDEVDVFCAHDPWELQRQLV